MFQEVQASVARSRASLGSNLLLNSDEIVGAIALSVKGARRLLLPFESPMRNWMPPVPDIQRTFVQSRVVHPKWISQGYICSCTVGGSPTFSPNLAAIEPPKAALKMMIVNETVAFALAEQVMEADRQKYLTPRILG